MEAGRDRQAIHQKRTTNRLDEQLIKCKGVIGIDVEHKRVNGQKTDTLGVTVYVEKKLPLQQLSADEAIPPTISDIPTDVVECVNLWGLWKPSKQMVADVKAQPSKGSATVGTDPLVGGLSIANQYDHPGVFGTLGIILTSNYVPTALSCAHVMVDPEHPPREQGVTEPPGNYPANSMGKVSLYYYGGDENVDAALVPIISGRSSSLWTVKDIGTIHGWGTASVGDNVEKVGAASEHTFGEISSTTFTLTIFDPNWGVRTFTNLIKVDGQFASPGDSGSAVINRETKKMVGMVKAGGQTRTGVFSVSHRSAYLQAMIK